MQMARNLLSYPGTKRRACEWILQHLPRGHKRYLEPFGGTAIVLLNKEPHYEEHYNDLNGELVNLFRVLQQPAKHEALRHRLRYTLYAQAEYERALEIVARYRQSGVIEDEVDLAWATFVSYNMSYGGLRSASQIWYSLKTHYRASVVYRNRVESLDWVAERLAKVYVHQRDAVEIIKRFDHQQVLMFLDPPYRMESRSSNGAMYEHESHERLHEQILEFLLHSRCAWALSVFDDPYYEVLLERQGVQCYRKRVQVCLSSINGEKGIRYRDLVLYVYNNLSGPSERRLL